MYGIDTNTELTPDVVRNALVRCFYEAHKEDACFEEDAGELYFENIIRQSFKKTSFDYDHPTKEALRHVLDDLADFAKNFRSQDIIQKHYRQMLVLIERLP